MASDVNELLDQLFGMIDDAKNVPLSGDKCMLDRDKALDLIDDIRGQLPSELTEAKKLLTSRSEYIDSAKRESALIIKQAEEKAKQMVAENELLSQAKQRSQELLRQSEEKSRELKKAANAYCEDALRRTEDAVAEAYDDLKKSHARFRSTAGMAPSSQGTASDSPKPFDAAKEG